MNLGFEFSTTAAKPKRPVDDAPTQVPMRGTGSEVRRKPSADQKKVRRQMARQQRRTATKESSMSRQREVEILQAMAKADLPEQRRLAQELEDLRASRTASLQADRDLDLASTVIRDTLTPVAVHERHTAATDWITELPTVVEGSYDNEMRTEATLWFRNLHEAVRADAEEFGEQAQGMARRMAGKFGEAAPAAAQTFLDTAARLYTLANEDNGHGESTVTDYDTKADQDPLYAEDWEGHEPTAVHPPMPGAGQGPNTLSSRREAGPYGSDSFKKCPKCGGNNYAAAGSCSHCGARLKTEDSEHGWKASKTAVSLTNVGIEGDNGVGTDPSGNRVKFRLSEKDKADLKAVLYSDLAVNFSGVDVEESDIIREGSTTAKRCPACEGGGVFADSLCYVCGGDGQVEGSRTASEGQTCSVCGDKIARDPQGEDPRTWHHDNGEKHDHEAKPSSKESARRQAGGLENFGDDRAEPFDEDDDEKKEARRTAARECKWTRVSEVGEDDGLTWYECSTHGKTEMGDGADEPQFPCEGWLDENAAENPYQGSRRTAGPKHGDKDVCHADGKPIEFFDGQWYHLKGGPSHNDVYPATPKEKAEKESRRVTADGPTHTFPCKDCGSTVERYRGQYDVNCPSCGAPHNAGGQRLRDDYAGNPSMYDDEIGDLEGYEMQHAYDASKRTAGDQGGHAYDNGDPIGGGWGPKDVACKVCGKDADDPAHLFGTDGRYSSLQVTAARPIHQIADDIVKEWGVGNINYAARPYLDAMRYLETLDDSFGADSAKHILAYFLSNAASFRGGRAKELKDELRAIQKGASKTAAEACPGTGRPLRDPGPFGEGRFFGKRLGKCPECGKTVQSTNLDTPRHAPQTKEAGGRRGNDFSISDAKNEDGEWIMSPEQIRAEMGVSEPDPDDYDDFYDEDERYASRRQAGGNPNGPQNQDGGADSSLEDVEVGDENDKPMWPWELAEGDPATGEGAANVANVPTPGGEKGYPQPKSSSVLPAQGRISDFRDRVQAGLARMEAGRDPFVREAAAAFEVPEGAGARDFVPEQTLAQIGRMNILSISGGRVVPIHKGSKVVGLALPVAQGYAATVFLDNDDTYIVQRTWRGKVKGEVRGVYADELGEVIYRAGMYHHDWPSS